MTEVCKYCSTEAASSPADNKNCSSLAEVYRITPQRPFGCPWMTKEDRARLEAKVAGACTVASAERE